METIHTGRKPPAAFFATVLPGLPALASNLGPAPLRFLLTLTFALLLFTLLPAHSATQSWNPNGDGSGGNGTWDTGITADWDTGVAWTDSNDALFSGTGGTVDLVTPTANSLTFSATGPYLLQSGTLILSGSDITVNSDATIASAITASAGLFVTGNSTLTLTGSSTLGAGFLTVDSGTVTIANGGLVTGGGGNIGYDPGSTGAVTVDGTGSQWIITGQPGLLFVGNFGNGSLTISNGGAVTDGIGLIGESASSSGTATVSGTGSIWTSAGELAVGDHGIGSLVISNGGKVFSGDLEEFTSSVIGNNPGSSGTVTVSGSGSTWTDASNISIGEQGAGTLSIIGGGSVSDVNGSVGDLGSPTQSGTGTVTVSGNGSTWTNSDQIYVGNIGTGSLTITNGGAVFSGSGSVIGFNAGSNGTATVSGTGSSWSTGGGLATGANGIYYGGLAVGDFGTGSLTITNGGSVTDPNAWIGYGLNSRGTVTVSGSGSVWTTQLGNFGFYVGEYGSGTLSVTNGGQVADGAFLTYIGDQAGSSGSVVVDGQGSELALSPYGNFDVGNSGSGTLIISNGGAVAGSSNETIIASGSNSAGSATVSGAGSAWTAYNLTVGGSGTGTLLVSSGGTMSGVVAEVGDNPGSSGAVTVSGTGSAWTLSSNLAIGEAGAGSLLITGGGFVSDVTAVLGDPVGAGYITTSGTGTVAVTGTGSTWANSGYLSIGLFASGSLLINDGGAVSSGTAGLDGSSIGQMAGASGLVTVTGSGSVWADSSYLFIARYGNGTLLISKGGVLSSGTDYVGNSFGQSGSWLGYGTGSAGIATVSGPGSIWTDSGNLYIGESGTGTLMITGGGAVSAGGDAVIGDEAGSLGTVTVSGSNSTWTASGNLIVGGSGKGTLTITSGGAVSDQTRGYSPADAANIGNNPGSNGAVTVSGSGSTWTNNGDVYIGDSGTGALTITSDATVSAGAALVGYYPGSRGTVVVTGSGSELANGNGIRVGDAGSGSLLIANGATVDNGGFGFIGNEQGSTGVVTVNGMGSKWINTSGICVGVSGSASLLISNGGVVSNGVGNGFSGVGVGLTGDSQYGAGIGVEGGSIGSVAVTGAGSTWTESGDLFVGFYGTGSLLISNGGAVSSAYCEVSVEPGSSGSVTVTGSGSTWTNGAVFLGSYADTASLLISNGGTVISSSAVYGSWIANGSATVTGNGSIWEVAGRLSIDSDIGTLLISAGGRVSDPIGSVEDTGTAGGAAATVTGSGSAWTNSLLLIGPDSNGGTLLVSNGGAVSSGTAYIGGDPFYPYATATGMATVSGSGSTWTNSGQLSIGESGSGTLIVTNGGAVSSGSGGVIGDQAGSSGTLSVSGSGSSWTSGGNITVGGSGTGTLVVTGGATIGGGYGIIGAQSGSVGTATVSGSGSSWHNSAFGAGGLYAGYSGAGTLLISNGGAVDDPYAGDYLGYLAGSKGSVTVSGRGSNWADSTLYVGYYGNGSLLISNGGTVVSDESSNNTAVLGYQAGSDGSAIITGSGSTWTSYDFNVGESGTGSLLISAGAFVSDYILAQVGFNPGSSGRVTVTGTGSTWSTGSGLAIGVHGDGSLLISNGGSVDSIESYIAESGGSGIVTVSGSGSTWTNGGDLFVALSGTGRLVISSGGAVSSRSSFIGGYGYGGISTGAVTVGGSGSIWNSGVLSVGAAGAGTLLVENGGTVSSTSAIVGDQAGSTGSVTVTGPGSGWTNGGNVTISNSGTGILTLTDGGLVTVSGTTTLGSHGTLQFDGSSTLNTGSLLIDGGILRTLSASIFTTSATLNAGGVIIGTDGFNSTFTGDFTGAGGIVKVGTGALTLTGSSALGGNLSVGTGGSVQISAGGFVSDAESLLGDAAGSASSATVSGAGSKWTTTGGLFVGLSGSATLAITSGGVVSDSNGTLGYNSGSNGSATVSGSGSKWTSTANLFIGYSGAGTLSITTGGLVSAAGITSIGSAGTLALDGASAFDTGSLTVNGGTVMTLGALTFAPSATLGAGGVNINTDGFNSTFSGAFSGAGGLAKSGSGTLTLTGYSAYTGVTSVTAGTLALTTGTGHIATLGNTAITVSSGATFAATLGASPVYNKVIAGATGPGTTGATLDLAPGSAFSMAGNGLATFYLLQQNAFSGPAFTIGGASGIAPTLTFDIGNAASGADLIHVTKTVDVLATGGKIDVSALAGDTSLTIGSYDLITSAGGFSGTGGNGFTLTDTTLAISGKTYDFSLANSTTDDEILTVTAAPAAPSRVSMETAGAFFAAAPALATAAVPEPGTTASLLTAFGLVAASLLRRRRR